MNTVIHLVLSHVYPSPPHTVQSPVSSLPIMVPVIMNPSKPVSPIAQVEQHPAPLQATLGQQDMLSNLQNAKLLQSLLQVASTLPTQPLLPMGQVSPGLSAPLNLQSLLQGVPPTSSGFLPLAQPAVNLDTAQLAQSDKPAASPYLVRPSAFPSMYPGSQSSTASSATLPLQQAQSASLSTVTGEGKKTALPLAMSVGSLKSATPRGPKRTPLAQVNMNVTPVQDTFGLLKPALRTEGCLPRVAGYHGNSTLLPTANPVMLTDQCSVGYGGGGKLPPLGDRSTWGQRETQTDKETV